MNHNYLSVLTRFLCYFFPIIIVTGLSNLAFSQIEPVKPEVQKSAQKSEEPIFMIVEQQPEFPGGPDAKLKFFSKNLVTPKLSPELKMKGKVIVSFVVNADGSFQDLSLIKSLHPEYDREALRVVNLMPKWIAGKQSGRTMRVRYILPVEFR